MPLINREVFVDNFTKPEVLARFPYHISGFAYEANVSEKLHLLRAKPDRRSALALLDAMGACIKRGMQQHKSGRPWDLLPNLFDSLNRHEPWWGWEFETGWASREQQLKAVGYVWDNFDGCMFDGEGEGLHQVEITFTPQEMSKYLDGTATACKFMKWVSDNKHMIYQGNHNDVGTHLNISHPRLSLANAESAARFLNRTLWFTQKRNGDRIALFGRESVYAGFHANSSNNGNNVWLEFKGFRTTYDYDRFMSFIATANGLQKALDIFLSKDGKFGPIAKPCMSNLFEVVKENAEPVVESLNNLKIPAGAKQMYTRRCGGANPFGPM